MSRQVSRGRRVAPPTRPRYRRVAAALCSLLVTLVAVLAGVGLLPTSSAEERPVAAAALDAEVSAPPSGHGGAQHAAPSSSSSSSHLAATSPATTLPADSGTGRRVVFGIGAQRVWLVDAGSGGRDVVRRTYPVSGSVTDNLQPGTYSVYSKSEHAIGVDDSGTMRYMVRVAHGAQAAIGFHDIPVLDGHLVQTRDMLGTPQSHGCIRQWRPDAMALWRFAPVGTPVVVVA